MKILTTNGLTKLIELIKSTFIKNTDVVETETVDVVETETVDVVETETVDVDTVVTQGSNNLITSGAVSDAISEIDIPVATSDLINDSGYITGINSSDVTTALGYTPYNSSNPNGYQTSAQVNTAVTSYHDSTKQDTLISGTNIKTINNNSILGSGNIDIQGGSEYTEGNGIDITDNEISIDTEVVATKTDLNAKQNTISDLATIRNGASAGATAVQPATLNNYATTTALTNGLATKQNKGSYDSTNERITWS